ncbi:TAXI family TRAP transporter solute-binding subunit [Marinivivus vitaminiproducens]|uniref:TAXI family TRAP transporter solute-binding subunit n=1 Tax=Marinivivus vitaminiproducens TaxID=3035935 RepID=UPI0027A21BC8|nr:TAXI family TRAP transporter solute-binding subunit [Geminicoccaceae bacterium SCSIO 64248]
MSKRTWTGTAIACAVTLGATLAIAQDMSFFRIGTGGTGGTYYPVGGLLAQAVSSPPGSPSCEEGGPCGVPGLVAIAQASNGSVANINGMASGGLESGFAQADVAYWAYTGTGLYEDQGKVDSVRALANLYPESIHLVARKGAGIQSVADLAGKRVSLDEPGSGTLVDARIILEAYGLSEDDVEAEYIKSAPAIDQIRDGQLDAFFFVGGYPAGSIVELASSVGAEIVPIEGEQAAAIMEEYPFFASDTIPAGTYEGVGEVPTIAVGAQWLVSSSVDEELVYKIAETVWNDKTRALLDAGHAKGRLITKETALEGIGIPLHPGAERYYREQGLLQ